MLSPFRRQSLIYRQFGDRIEFYRPVGTKLEFYDEFVDRFQDLSKVKNLAVSKAKVW